MTVAVAAALLLTMVIFSLPVTALWKSWFTKRKHANLLLELEQTETNKTFYTKVVTWLTTVAMSSAKTILVSPKRPKIRSHRRIGWLKISCDIAKTSFINAMTADTCSVTPYANDNGKFANLV